MRSVPSIAASLPVGQDVYLVLDDFGASLGRAWRETNEDRTDRETVITDLIEGQYSDRARVVASIPRRVGRAMCPRAGRSDCWRKLRRWLRYSSDAREFHLAPGNGQETHLSLPLRKRQADSRSTTVGNGVGDCPKKNGLLRGRCDRSKVIPSLAPVAAHVRITHEN
jgi:hypothetical protein